MNESLKIRDEEKLLIGLCRLEFTETDIFIIGSLITGTTDWEYFKTLTHIHGVSALVYHNLERFSLLDNIPPQVADFLKKALMLSLSRNTFNAKALSEIIGLLNRAEIKTVLLKGQALEISVYGNMGLRQMSDADILINRKDCLKARQIILDAGYHSLPVKSFLHKFILADFGKHLPALIKNGTSIEIHHDIFRKDRNSLTGTFIDTSYSVELNGEKTWLPEPQIFLIYLIRHLYVHERTNESQLRLYTDLVVLIGFYKEKIINRKLIEVAYEACLVKEVARYLGILREVWSISFPGWLNSFIDLNFTHDCLEDFSAFLRSPRHNLQLRQRQLYREFIHDIPGIHRKIIFIIGDLFPSLKFMRKRYGCRNNLSAFLHYPHRLGKLTWLFRR